SSSLVAVHLACRSLQAGEATVALAGGVNVILDPRFTTSPAPGGFLPPAGRCQAFDARANRHVRGGGAGVAVRTRLARARAGGVRRGRPHQGRAGAGAPPDPAQPALPPTQPVDPLRHAAAARAAAAGPLARRRPGACRPELLLAFVYSGQGPQWWAMGRELLG